MEIPKSPYTLGFSTEFWSIWCFFKCSAFEKYLSENEPLTITDHHWPIRGWGLGQLHGIPNQLVLHDFSIFFLFKIGYLWIFGAIPQTRENGRRWFCHSCGYKLAHHQVYSQSFDEHPVNLPFPHDNLEKTITKHNSQWLAQAFCIPKCVQPMFNCYTCRSSGSFETTFSMTRLEQTELIAHDV